MAGITKELIATVNQPGRIGTLSTIDNQGHPNVAYFSSPRLEDDGTLVVGLGRNRTLKNLETNPYAVLFVVEGGPVSFTTRGCRLYLKAREIQTEGPRLDAVREMVAKTAGAKAAKIIVAAVVFDVTEIRPMIAMA